MSTPDTKPNNTDLELLKLAAQAAGLPATHWNDGLEPYSSGEGYVIGDRIWNPLADDGDALRLAVRLRMLIDTEDLSVNGIYFERGGNMGAAMRRAIVHAAAGIGGYVVPQPQLFMRVKQDGGEEDPFQTAVIFTAPKAWGKTRNASQLLHRFGLDRLVDDWQPGMPIKAKTLHLTNVPPCALEYRHPPQCRVVEEGWSE